MMRIPGSIRRFREASQSVKHEIGDMIDILSRQEEETLHIAYNKDNINRMEKVADREVTDGHGFSTGPGIADYAENTIQTRGCCALKKTPPYG